MCDFKILNNVYKCGDCTSIVIPPNVYLDNIILQLHVKLNVRFYMKLLEDICQNSPHLPFLPNELVDRIVHFIDILEDIDQINWLLIDYIEIKTGTFSNKINARWNDIYSTMIFSKTMKQLLERQGKNKREFYISLPLRSLICVKNCYNVNETILKIKWKTPKEYNEDLHELITYTDYYDQYTIDPCVQVLESYLSYRIIKPTNKDIQAVTCSKIHLYTRKLIKAQTFDVSISVQNMSICRVYLTLSDSKMIMKDVQLYCDHPMVTSPVYCYTNNTYYTSLQWCDSDYGLIVNNGTIRLTGDLNDRFSGNMYIHLMSKEDVPSLYISSE